MASRQSAAAMARNARSGSPCAPAAASRLRDRARSSGWVASRNASWFRVSSFSLGFMGSSLPGLMPALFGGLLFRLRYRWRPGNGPGPDLRSSRGVTLGLRRHLETSPYLRDGLDHGLDKVLFTLAVTIGAR